MLLRNVTKDPQRAVEVDVVEVSETLPDLGVQVERRGVQVPLRSGRYRLEDCEQYDKNYSQGSLQAFLLRITITWTQPGRPVDSWKRIQASCVMVSVMDVPSLLPAILLAIGCIVYVFWPQKRVAAPVEKTRLDYLRERKDVLYDNLRDLNFEFRAGKYPEDDYTRQRESLEGEAAGVIAEMERLS